MKNQTKFIAFFLFSVLWAFSMFFSSCGDPEPITISGTYDVINDTAYVANGHALQKMDLHLPTDRNASTPVVIVIHGGGWESGSKEEMNPIVDNLKGQWPEVAIANINYRLTSQPNVHYTEITSDVQSAVNFLVTNKTALGVSDKFYMIGHSAGAHLAMLYTYKHNVNDRVKAVADYCGPSHLADWDWYNSNPEARRVIGNLMGAPWDSTLYASFSPISFIQSTSKPTIIFHSDSDLTVPIHQGYWLKARLDSVNVPNLMDETKTLFHAISDYPGSVGAIVAFFKAHN